MTTLSTVRIVVGSAKWLQKAHEAIEQKRRVKLVAKGTEANTIATALTRTQNVASQKVISDGVIVTALVCTTIIAALGLGTVAAVCLYGMSQGYKVKAKHIVNGPWPFDDEIEFDLVPPT